MRAKIFPMIMIVAFALIAVGCAKKTCETIADECDMDNDLEEACVDDYKSGGDCRSALRDLKKCVEENGCDSECDSEFDDVYDECGEIRSIIEGYYDDYYYYY